MMRELGSGRNCSRETGKSACPHHFCARPIADHTHVSSTSLKNPFDLTEVTIEPNGSVGLDNCERRTLLKGLGGTLALPFLESDAFAKKTPDKEPLRFLVVGNPFGMHPGNFFPMDFGKDYQSSLTLKSLDWLRDRLTIISHTDHNMVSGHGREISFLSGVLPTDAQSFPEKNMSLDQLFARHVGSQVRFPSVGASLDSGIRMSWTANGVEKLPITDPQQLFNHLFLNLTDQQKKLRKQMIARNASILDTVGDQFSETIKRATGKDRERLQQFETSVRELELTLSDRLTWIDRNKPKLDLGSDFLADGTIRKKYEAIFDMIAYAFETDLTRVATIEFPAELNYTDLSGVNRSYHGCTHNGRGEDLVNELVAIESFQIECLSRCLKKLDSIRVSHGDESMLDRTIVLFGSGMGYGGTHSNRDLPILVAGGGFKHLGHVDVRDNAGRNMPLCNLYLTLMQRFGIERDSFNTSTGSFEALDWS